MSMRFTIVEATLNRAEFRWKWIRFCERTLLLIAVLAFAFLVLGGCMVLGIVHSKAAATTFFTAAGVIGFVVWLIIVFGVAAGGPARNALARAVEKIDPRLLDRLNTMLFLEPQVRDPRAQSFATRIARQMQHLFSQAQPALPFSAAGAWRMLALCTALVTVTSLFYGFYSPWKKMIQLQAARQVPAEPSKNLELPPPADNNVEQKQPWGEVKISEPGIDLKVTKVDVVPLQIEAAANQALNKVGWFSTINGAQETPHALPAPSEPRYAVYQPVMYLDELGLSDWDVLTYYAKADVEGDKSYASEVYFLEVRPFREDILKMPGGESGNAYRCMNELSALIEQQQHIIRQTHYHGQNPPPQASVAAQERKKLAEAETDLGDSSRHLYASMANRMQDMPIGEALDNLAKAEKSLRRASGLLSDNVMADAQDKERQALSELVAARKMFQKAVTDNPDAFKEDQKPEDSSPIADASKRLSSMAEFRNEAKAAEDFLKNTIDQQKKLRERSLTTPRNLQPTLADKENELERALNDFQEQHPRVFKGADNQSQEAHQAMKQTADLLSKRQSTRAAMDKAEQKLEALKDAVQNRSEAQQLANTYQLKEMLDRQIQKMDQASKPDSNVPGQELSKTARDARSTVNELKKAAEQEPTSDAFGPALRQSLSGQKKVELDAKLSQLEQSNEPGAQKQLAGEARDRLGEVSKAFGASEPKSLQAARKKDSLRPGKDESLSQGMAELESLLKQLENERPISPEARDKQARQALSNLQTGMRERYGDNSEGNQILLHLEQLLKEQASFQPDELKRLLEQLQRFSIEVAEKQEKQVKPDLANIDPARLPPAYRGRIQKYFQKLSEK